MDSFHPWCSFDISIDSVRTRVVYDDVERKPERNERKKKNISLCFECCCFWLFRFLLFINDNPCIEMDILIFNDSFFHTFDLMRKRSKILFFTFTFGSFINTNFLLLLTFNSFRSLFAINYIHVYVLFSKNTAPIS
jgi:hypothetical protein